MAIPPGFALQQPKGKGLRRVGSPAGEAGWCRPIGEYSGRRQQGFTLLEVLVALIIFAIAFGAIAGIFQTSLRQSTTAETLFAATALAEHQITRFGSELPLTVGQSSGISAEGFAWHADVNLAAPIEENSGVALYQVTIDVSSGDDGPSHITLRTLRLGPPP